LRTHGGILTTEQITSWLSQEVGKQEKHKSSGAARVKSLETVLQELKIHMTKRPLDYWIVYDDGKIPILKASALKSMSCIFDIKGITVAEEKREKLNLLSLNKAKVDEKVVEVGIQIQLLNEVSKHHRGIFVQQVVQSIDVIMRTRRQS